MQKVIGLDIGSYSIKAIEIVNTFNSYEITNFYETIVPSLDDVPLDAIVPICMEQLFKENRINADRIITAMPGQFISSRILPFNFSDPNKIDASIMVELEDHVPFNMDDMIVDHQILGPARGKTMVLAVMTRKAFLKNFLDLLARIDIDPKLVDIDSLAFYNLSSHLNLTTAGNYAMVDIGHEKTSVCIIKDGVLRMFRSINLGGRYITEFLARDLECNYHQAQRIKHRISRVLTRQDPGSGLDDEAHEVADRITLSTNAIVKELGRTFYAYKSWEKDRLEQIFISGGTSRIQNIDLLLSEQLEIPVSRLKLNHTQLKIADSVAEHMESVPQSLAIGLRAVTNVKKHSKINLRRGEFAYVQNYENFLRGAATAFKVIGASIVLLIISYALKYYFYQDQIKELQSAYIKVYKSNFPDAKTQTQKFSVVKQDAATKLNQGINEFNSAVSEYQLANSTSPALEILSELSASIPKELPIDVTLFEFKTTFPGQGKLTVKGETDGFEQQAKIIDAMKTVKVLKNIEEGKSANKIGAESNKIEFTVNAAFDLANR